MRVLPRNSRTTPSHSASNPPTFAAQGPTDQLLRGAVSRQGSSTTTRARGLLDECWHAAGRVAFGMGDTIERAEQIVRRMGLARYRGIIRQGGHRWGIEHGAALPLTFRRLESGLYALTDRHFSATTQASLKAGNGVVCLLTALWIHGVLQREPDEVHIAIGERARRPRWRHPPAVFYRMTQRLLTADTERVYVDSFPVTVFSLARTILDCHRFRRSIGAGVADLALDLALERNLLAPYPLWRLAQRTRAKGWARVALRKRGHLSARDVSPFRSSEKSSDTVVAPVVRTGGSALLERT
jgi:hypothetical protein